MINLWMLPSRQSFFQRVCSSLEFFRRPATGLSSSASFASIKHSQIHRSQNMSLSRACHDLHRGDPNQEVAGLLHLPGFCLLLVGLTAGASQWLLISSFQRSMLALNMFQTHLVDPSFDLLGIVNPHWSKPTTALLRNSATTLGRT